MVYLPNQVWLISFFPNTATDSKRIWVEMQKYHPRQKWLISEPMKTQKSNLEHESMIISWILNKKKKTPNIENKFSKEYCKKKKMQPNYLEAFFPAFLHFSFLSLWKREIYFCLHL